MSEKDDNTRDYLAEHEWRFRQVDGVRSRFKAVLLESGEPYVLFSIKSSRGLAHINRKSGFLSLSSGFVTIDGRQTGRIDVFEQSFIDTLYKDVQELKEEIE